MRNIITVSLVALAAFSLSACGGQEASTSNAPSSATSTTDAASTPSAESSPSEETTPATTPEAADQSAASPTPAATAAAVGEPKGTMLLLSTVPPKTVGDYTGKQLTTKGLGKGEKIQWEYSSASGDSDMSLVANSLEHEKMVANLKQTQKLGKIGTCGYLYGNKSTPICMVRLENGANLSIGGDYNDTLDQTRAFASQFLALAKTK